jgi:hypothetical protein
MLRIHAVHGHASLPKRLCWSGAMQKVLPFPISAGTPVSIARTSAIVQMMLLMSGRVHCERFARGPGSTKQTAVALPGSLLGAATLLCGTGSRELYTAASTCHVLAICMHELANVLTASAAAYLDLLFAGSHALAYYIRRRALATS